MNKTLAQYIEESEQWIDSPALGDDFAINIREECLLESHIVEVSEDAIVIEADDQMMEMLESYGMLGEKELAERIQRYGAVGSNPGQGYTVSEAGRGHRDGRDGDYEDEDEDGQTMADRARRDGRGGDEDNDSQAHPQPPMKDPWNYVQDSEADFRRVLELAGISETETNTTDPLADKAAALAPVGADGSQEPVTTMDESVMSSIDMDLRHIARTQRMDALVDAMRGEFGIKTQQYLQGMMDDVEHSLEQRGQQLTDAETKLRMLMDRIQEIYSQDLDEAEYQGREVPLGKPMANTDGKSKSKVYVKDPKTGNVKKVTFGDPNMRIKKSNPARRKSFRARHRCENPGPRTKARYWACRSW